MAPTEEKRYQLSEHGASLSLIPLIVLQEAHVGLGLMGKEGRAAVRSADFAFAKFRFLKKVPNP